MAEYLDMNLNPIQLEEELVKLINKFDSITGKHLFIYSVDFNKSELPISMNMDDLYTIKDVLRKDSSDKLSFFIETPGGSGEAAEEIAKLIRTKYDYVEFIVVGECKSAGTILATCGDEIYLNDTGSLGPIDAQIHIGRSTGSAHDYMKWINDKIDEANKNGYLNNFDSLIITQISPNELVGVQNSLDFGKELVTTFLKKYKFKNWKYTETQKKEVTDEMREKRAQEIADKLSDHSLWKSHGRSLKIDTLQNEVQLKINDLTENPEICEILEKIQALIKILYSSTSAFKIIADKKTKLIKSAIETSSRELENNPSVAHISVECDKCGRYHEIYINITKNNSIDNELINKGLIPFPDNGVLVCECGNELNLNEITNNIYNKFHN